MADQKELKLIINAQNMSGKTLSEVSASIESLNDKIEEQAALAKKGEGSTRSLTESVKQLGEAEKALLAKQALADNLARTSEAMANAKIRAEELRAEIVRLKSSNEVSPVATFTADLKKLEQELARTERAMGGTLQKQFAAAEANAAKAGITTANLAEQNVLAERSARRLAEGYATTSKALLDYDSAQARTAAITKELDTTERERIALAKQAEKQIEAEARAESLLAQARAQSRSATASARGATGLVAATKGAAAVSPDLTNKLNAIINPAQQARASLTGIEDEVRKLNGTIGSVAGPMSDYREQLSALQQSQRAIANQGAAIDAYRQQIAALRQARSEFVAARADVLRYADQLRKVDSPSEELSAGLRRAQNALSATTSAMQNQILKTRTMREELGAAGINSRNLVDAESRLANAARTNVTSIEELTKAYSKYGESKNKAAAAGGEFAEGGKGGSGERTTLGYMQRLKGQVLATALAYASLQGAITGVKSVIEASVAKTGIEMQLGALLDTTDMKKIGAEYDYLHDKALYYGQSIDSLAQSYTQFAVAAKGQNISAATTKKMFEQLTQSFAVFHLSGEKSSRVMTQLTQMIGKGKVQAEDLRTVAESMANAPSAMAKGLQEIGIISKDSTNAMAEMYGLMKDGSLDAKVAVMALTEELAKQTGPQLPAAIKSMNSEMERFKVRLVDFQQKIAEAGFGDAFTAFLSKVNTLMADTKSAKTFSDLLVSITKLLGFMLDHLKEIVTVIEFFAARKVLMAIGTLGTNLIGMAKAAKIASAEVGALRGTISLLSSSPWGLVATGVAAVGVAIYDYMQQAEAAAQQTKSLSQEIDKLRDSYKDLDAAGVTAAANMANQQRNLLMSQQMAIQQRIAGLQSRLQMPGPKDEVAIHKELDKETTALKQLNGELAKQEDLMGKLQFRQKQLEGGDLEKKAEEARAKQKLIDEGAAAKAKEAAEKLAEKLAAKELSLMNQLDAMRSKVEKRETENLQSRLAGIDSEYQKLFRAIEAYGKMGGGRAGEFKATASELRDKLQLQEVDKFTKAYADKYGKLADDISNLDAKVGRKQKDDLQRRLEAVSATFAPVRAEIAAMAQAAEQLPIPYDRGDLAAASERVDLIEREAKIQETKKFNAEALVDKEKEMNDILAARKSQLEIISQQEAAGDISHLEAINRTNAMLAVYQGSIEDTAKTSLEFANGLRDALDPEVYDKFVQAMNEASGSANKLQQSLYSTAEANKDISAGLTTTVSTLAQGLGKAVTGADSLGGAFRNAGRAFMKFAADFLLKIGEMILQQKILESISSKSDSNDSAGGGWGSIISKGIGAVFGGSGGDTVQYSEMLQYHSGGVVGSGGQRSGRTMSHRSFDGAPKYHSGGVVGGLQADEQRAILKRGEEVLTKSNPRHIANAGKSSGSPVSQPQNIKIMNMIDSGSVMSEGLATKEGEKAIINFMRANRTTLKQVLG